MKKIIGFLIGVLIVYILTIILLMINVSNLKNEVKKLKKENEEMEEQVFDYKWQLDQLPYICTYLKEGE